MECNHDIQKLSGEVYLTCWRDFPRCLRGSKPKAATFTKIASMPLSIIPLGQTNKNVETDKYAFKQVPTNHAEESVYFIQLLDYTSGYCTFRILDGSHFKRTL